MSKLPEQQPLSQQKKVPLSTISTLILSTGTMSGQSATHEVLKQINMMLQGYTSHFAQGKTMAEIKTTMTGLKSLVDLIKTDMTTFTANFQELEMCWMLQK